MFEKGVFGTMWRHISSMLLVLMGKSVWEDTLLGAFCDRTRRSYQHRGSVRKRLVPVHFAGQCVMCQINMRKKCFAGYLQNQKE